MSMLSWLKTGRRQQEEKEEAFVLKSFTLFWCAVFTESPLFLTFCVFELLPLLIISIQQASKRSCVPGHWDSHCHGNSVTDRHDSRCGHCLCLRLETGSGCHGNTALRGRGMYLSTLSFSLCLSLCMFLCLCLSKLPSWLNKNIIQAMSDQNRLKKDCSQNIKQHTIM